MRDFNRKEKDAINYAFALVEAWCKDRGGYPRAYLATAVEAERKGRRGKGASTTVKRMIVLSFLEGWCNRSSRIEDVAKISSGNALMILAGAAAHATLDERCRRDSIPNQQLRRHADEMLIECRKVLAIWNAVLTERRDAALDGS